MPKNLEDDRVEIIYDVDPQGSINYETQPLLPDSEQSSTESGCTRLHQLFWNNRTSTQRGAMLGSVLGAAVWLGTAYLLPGLSGSLIKYIADGFTALGLGWSTSLVAADITEGTAIVATSATVGALVGTCAEKPSCCASRPANQV